MKNILMFGVISLLILTACSRNRQRLSPRGNLNLKSANVYFQQRDDDKALEKALMLYEKVLTDNPNHMLALKRSADINYHFALQIEPLRTERDGKVAYSRMDNAQQAINYFKTTYGKYDSVLTVIGTFEKLNDRERAIRRDSSRKKEGSFIKLLRIGQYLADKANNPKPDFPLSISTLEYLHQLEPERQEPMRMLVAVYHEVKDTTKYEQFIRKILAVSPDDPEMMEMMAALYFNNQKYEQALELYKRIMVVRPLDINNMLLLAETHIILKEKQPALIVLDRALQLEPENLNVLKSAKNISRALANVDAEMGYWSRILSLSPSVENLEAYVLRKVTLNDYTNLMPYAERWFEKAPTDKNAVIACFNIAKAIGRKDLELKYGEIFKRLNR